MQTPNHLEFVLPKLCHLQIFVLPNSATNLCRIHTSYECIPSNQIFYPKIFYFIFCLISILPQKYITGLLSSVQLSKVLRKYYVSSTTCTYVHCTPEPHWSPYGMDKLNYNQSKSISSSTATSKRLLVREKKCQFNDILLAMTPTSVHISPYAYLSDQHYIIS